MERNRRLMAFQAALKFSIWVAAVAARRLALEYARSKLAKGESAGIIRPLTTRPGKVCRWLLVVKSDACVRRATNEDGSSLGYLLLVLII